MSNLSKKWLRASAAAGAFFMATTQAAKSDFGVTMAVAGLTQSLLAAGAKGNDTTMVALMGQMRMLEDLHARMDNIEASLAFIMQQLAQMDEKLRKSLDEDRDINRSENIYGKVQVIQRLMGELANEKSTERAKVIRMQIENRAYNLAEERFSLQKRSAFVVPTLITTMVTEVNAMRAYGANPEQVRIVLNEYDTKLQSLLSPQEIGSLPYLRAILEKKSTDNLAEISEKVTGKKGATLLQGNQPWFKYTIHTPEKAVWGSCKTLNSKQMSYDGMERPVLIPTAPMHMELQRIDWESCIKGYIPAKDISWRDWNRNVTFTAPDPDNILVQRLSIDKKEPKEGKGLLPGSQRVASKDGAEAPKMKEHEALQNKIDVYNRQIDAILEIKRLEALTSAARIMVSRWNNTVASDLAKRAESIEGKARASSNRAEQIVLDKKVLVILEETKDTRVNSWQTISNVNREVSDSLERARKEKWRGELITVLSVFQASLQTQMAIESASMKRDAQQIKANSKPESKAVTALNGDTKIVNAVRKTQAPTPSYPSMLERDKAPIKPTDDLQTINRVQQILREAKSTPVKSWKKGSDGVAQQAIKLTEAMVLLDKMKPDINNDYEAHKGVRSAETAKDVVEGALKGGIAGMRKEGLKAAVMPTPVVSGTHTSEIERDKLRSQINGLFSDYYRHALVEELQKKSESRAALQRPLRQQSVHKARPLKQAENRPKAAQSLLGVGNLVASRTQWLRAHAKGAVSWVHLEEHR